MKQLFLTLLLALFCVGCAKKEVVRHTVYQDVYIPTPCNVDIPDRPRTSANVEHMVIDLIGYAKMLEIKLKACTARYPQEEM